MGKPASGTGLDTGSSLYAHLTAAGSAVWGMLEGSGSSSADSSGNGHGLTLDGTVSWSTDGAGNAILSFAGAAGGHAASVTSPPSFDGTASWSFAWRAKVSSGGTHNKVAGGITGPGGNAGNLDMISGFRLELDTRTAGTAYQFTGSTSFTADHDYLLVYDQPSARLHFYYDGAEDASSPLTVASNDAAILFAALGSGFNGSDTDALVGAMTYAYLMAGYAATSTDAGNLHANPYFIFSTGGGGATPRLLSLLGCGA